VTLDSPNLNISTFYNLIRLLASYNKKILLYDESFHLDFQKNKLSSISSTDKCGLYNVIYSQPFP